MMEYWKDGGKDTIYGVLTNTPTLQYSSTPFVSTWELADSFG
jgi:hypothetical protein